MSWDQLAASGARPYTSMHVAATVQASGTCMRTHSFPAPPTAAGHLRFCRFWTHSKKLTTTPPAHESGTSVSLPVLVLKPRQFWASWLSQRMAGIPAPGIPAPSRTLHPTEAREAHRQRRKCLVARECHARAG